MPWETFLATMTIFAAVINATQERPSDEDSSGLAQFVLGRFQTGDQNMNRVRTMKGTEGTAYGRESRSRFPWPEQG
jgi:hypothetical protein